MEYFSMFSLIFSYILQSPPRDRLIDKGPSSHDQRLPKGRNIIHHVQGCSLFPISVRLHRFHFGFTCIGNYFILGKEERRTTRAHDRPRQQTCLLRRAAFLKQLLTTSRPKPLLFLFCCFSLLLASSPCGRVRW